MASVAATVKKEQVVLGRMPQALGIGVGAAIVLNLLILFVGKALGATFVVPLGPTQEMTELPIIAIVLASLIPALAAAGFLAILGRFTARPFFFFQIVGWLFLVLSLVPPFTMPIDTATAIGLDVMHVVTGAAIILSLVRFTRA